MGNPHRLLLRELQPGAADRRPQQEQRRVSVTEADAGCPNTLTPERRLKSRITLQQTWWGLCRGLAAALYRHNLLGNFLMRLKTGGIIKKSKRLYSCTSTCLRFDSNKVPSPHKHKHTRTHTTRCCCPAAPEPLGWTGSAARCDGSALLCSA